MNKLYGTIQTELVDPELEAKIGTEQSTEPAFSDIPTDLYAAISTKTSNETSIDTPPVETKQYFYAVPNRLYTQIVPEKPSILAEERIFVYAPKVTRNSAGIAKFATEQFNIVDGEVSLKSSYLAEALATQLLAAGLIIVVTELPTIGVDSKIYVVPIDAATSNSYVWNSSSQTWTSLGIVALNLSDYYTKSQIDALLTTNQDTRLIRVFPPSVEEPAEAEDGEYWYKIK